jgi:hypothetical protein
VTPHEFQRAVWWVCTLLMAATAGAQLYDLLTFGLTAPETPLRLFLLVIGVDLVGVYLWQLRHDGQER